jgi:hypothetical protein
MQAIRPRTLRLCFAVWAVLALAACGGDPPPASGATWGTAVWDTSTWQP